jgi:hypothetical protein
VVSTWEQITLNDGTTGLVRRPDREAVWGAVLIAAAPAIIPSARALQLLGHRARQREVSYWIEHTVDLMKRMDLPRAW